MRGLLSFHYKPNQELVYIRVSVNEQEGTLTVEVKDSLLQDHVGFVEGSPVTFTLRKDGGT